MSDMREDFEEWHENEYGRKPSLLSSCPVPYYERSIENERWTAWQAARAQNDQGEEAIGQICDDGKGAYVELYDDYSFLIGQPVYTQPQPAVPEGWLVRRVDDRITVQHPDIGGYCASKDGNDHSATAPVILYHFASALLSTPTTAQADGCSGGQSCEHCEPERGCKPAGQEGEDNE